MKQFLKNRDGSIIVMAAIVLPIIILIVFGAADMSKYMGKQAKFEQVLDNSLLAGMSETLAQTESDFGPRANPFDMEVKARIERYLAANLLQEKDFTVENLDVTCNGDHKTASKCTATASGKVSGLLIASVAPTTVHHKVTVQRGDGKRVIEIVFAIDASASMCLITEATTSTNNASVIRYNPDEECKKLKAVQEVLSQIIVRGINANANADFYVGIVPYNHKVKFPDGKTVPLPLRAIEDQYDDIKTNYPNFDNKNYYWREGGTSGNYDNTEPLSPLLPLTPIKTIGDKNDVANHVHFIQQNPRGLGWQRSSIGMLASALMLDPAYNIHFGGHMPAALDSNESEKIIVILTDGANMGCCFATYPEGDFTYQYLYLYEVDNAYMRGGDQLYSLVNSRLNKQDTIQNRSLKDKYFKEGEAPQKGLCDTIKDNEITLHTITFDIKEHDLGGQEMKDLFKSCASSSHYYFDVQSGDNDSLKYAYETIASSLVRLRIVE